MQDTNEITKEIWERNNEGLNLRWGQGVGVGEESLRGGQRN